MGVVVDVYGPQFLRLERRELPVEMDVAEVDVCEVGIGGGDGNGQVVVREVEDGEVLLLAQ